ncbi:O-antigen ligase family protein [Maribacter spongiicola]|uniref:O-antigen ligase family protein n=1 Tax=Maribacter spongiicola TaxID=1206753 RepID=UPI003F9E8192
MKFIGKHIDSPDCTKNLKGNILPFILGIMPILSIVFDEKFVPLYILSLLIVYFFENDKKKRYTQNKLFLLPFIVMISVFLIYTIVSSDILLSLKVLERQISFILIPFIICTSNWNRQRLVVFFKVFTFGLSFFCLVSFIILFWFYINNLDWINTMNQVQKNNTYLLFKYPHLVDTHPTYWSYLLIFGSIITLGNWFFSFYDKKYTGFIMLLIFNVTILLLASRTPIIINILVFIYASFLLFKNKKKNISKKKILLTFICSLIILVFIIPRINLLMVKTADTLNDDRFYLWPIAIEQIKQNYYVLGEGLGMGNVMLKEFIIENGDVRKNYTSFDLHNQYLRHFLDMGALGFFALLYFIFFPITILKGSLIQPMYFQIIAMILLLCLALITEAPLYRLKGVMVFSIFYPVFLVVSNLQIITDNIVRNEELGFKID